jgi:hypothetical protein
MENFIQKIITPKFAGHTKYAELALITAFIMAGVFVGII